MPGGRRASCARSTRSSTGSRTLHRVACTLAVYILARLANMRGPVAAAEYASKLSQRELEALGAWKNPRTGLYMPVSKSTLHRVIASVDPEQIEVALQRFSMPRLEVGRAVALDGKRIRGANRNGEDHHETATLVDHATGAPLASLAFNAALFPRFAKRGREDVGSGEANASRGAQAYSTVLSGTLATFNAAHAAGLASAAVNRGSRAVWGASAWRHVETYLPVRRTTALGQGLGPSAAGAPPSQCP